MTLGPRGPQETAFAPIFEAIHRGLLQRERLLKLDTPLGANTLIPLRAVGDAKLGRDYTWTIDAATTRDDLNPDALIAQLVTLWIQQPRGVLDLNADYRPIHGYVHTVRRLGADGGLTSWQIGFSSALHFLRHRRDEHFWLDRRAGPQSYPQMPRSLTPYEQMTLSAWGAPVAAVDQLLAEYVHDSVAAFTSWPCALYEQRGIYCDQTRYLAENDPIGVRDVAVA